EGDRRRPESILDGHPRTGLKSTRDKSDLVFTLSSATLKESLRRGTNDFNFTSSASATLAALSVHVIP
ncbi:MAG: hypothetical protein HON70_12540, partial [Lentisphaerae bacterium]|nr:hypothetical protein [Lentisphaerota bacterium]